MIQVNTEDEAFLKRALSQGESILVLGAGASRASRNRQDEDVKLGGDLARVIAEAAGFSYGGEPLPIVLSAARPVLGDRGLLAIYKREYSDINPCDNVRKISEFTWRRLYTWNIDDNLNNALTSRIQRPHYYNGMSDDVVESDNLINIQVIKLHGDILHPDKGFIMSDSDYASALANPKHAWYRQLAKDYITFTPIFIGSSLSEPILSAEIERAKRSEVEQSGRGFIITPETISPIQGSAFRARGLVHINGSLSDFMEWVQSTFPKGNTPRDVISRTHNFAAADLQAKIANSDLEAVSALYPRDMEKIHARAIGAQTAEINREARRFLRGFPPNWDVAASSIPVWLSPTDNLYESLKGAISDRQRMFVVTGQAGSGKSTAIMQCLVKFGRENKDVPIYELTPEVRSVRNAFNVLQRLHDKEVIVYISDLFVFGDQLTEDLKSFPHGRITVVATARKGEWNEHLERRFGDAAVQHEFSRFTKADFQPLIDRLLEYVPAPAFKALSKKDRLSRFAQSREQLLIAMREATYSQNFSDTITNEYENLPDEDTRRLLMIVGIATAARVGIDPGSTREAYKHLSRSRSFEEAEPALEGIVSRLPNGRLFARHELYVRHIIDDVVDLDLLLDCMIAIAGTYTKYPVPVVRNLNKIEAALFRFCWNHKFIYEQCRRRNRLHDGERIYSQFEVLFQLDGHFWLQYGLYLKECGRFDEALVMLRRSIEAYRDNPFAVHAYAELQFAVALKRTSMDNVTRQLITEAVEQLEALDARQDDEIDQYPLVTLANLHVGTLFRHGEQEQARSIAKTYFDRLQQMERRISSERVTDARERLLRFVTLGHWEIRRPGNVDGRRRQQRFRAK